MEEGLQIFIGFAIALEVFSLFCCSLLIYCSFKVQPIRKPPGSLILVEIIFISIVQLGQLTATVFRQFQNDSTTSSDIFLVIVQAITIYCAIANSSYENWIVFELYNRLKVSKNAGSFKNRAIIYHITSNSLAFLLVSAVILGYHIEDPDRPLAVIYYSEWVSWLTISWLLLNIVTSITLTIMTAYKNSKLPNSNVKRFIDMLIRYMIVLITVRLLTTVALIISTVYAKKYETSTYNTKWTETGFIVFVVLANLLIFILRLNDPHIREFLKFRLKAMKYRIKDKMDGMLSKRSIHSSMSVNQNLIPVRKLFDDILIEKIEYQLISLAIAMLKGQDNYEEV